MSKSPLPLVNCHTHIFTADHVPPFLAKKFVPAPLHLLIHLGAFVAIFRWWYNGPARLRYSLIAKKTSVAYTWMAGILNKIYPLNVILGYYIFLQSFFIIYRLITPVFPPDKSWLSAKLAALAAWLAPFIWNIRSVTVNVLIILLVIILLPSGRNFLFFLSRMLWKVLSMLPGKQTRDLFRRYLNIGRYAFHRKQGTILSKLKGQYPKGTGFVVLPMDMEYMAAGTCRTRYRDQMDELRMLKQRPSNAGIFYPFLFADPRRFVPLSDEINAKPGDKIYFDWSIENNKVRLEDSFVKDYLEEYGFSGIKIYPALGYYPFDERLLALWKYAADRRIPILTHCIRGTIFYRGQKEWNWRQHPVFRQAMEGDDDNPSPTDYPGDGFENDEQRERKAARATCYAQLTLPELRNMDFSINFTHPLNYLCLLEEPLLRQLVGNATDERLRTLFGYNGPDHPMTQNLRHLKICMGHFGGDDEWKRYFEKDRYNYSSQLTKHPTTGIRFFKTMTGDDSPGKIEQLWRYTDWYSIICSMILQYPNVYADISYILHDDPSILPLLRQTLQNEGLKSKVLYGTDFFVVRNHKSDKNMYADMSGGLLPEEFDQIARLNPVAFLQQAEVQK